MVSVADALNCMLMMEALYSYADIIGLRFLFLTANRDNRTILDYMLRSRFDFVTHLTVDLSDIVFLTDITASD